MLIPHLQQKHTHRRGKKSPLICWAFFLSHYRQSSNVCNTVLVRATKEYKRGFEMGPFAVSFAQIRALDSEPECIYAVHRHCRGRHHKKAQSHLMNCSLSVTVFRSAQVSGKIWELNMEAKRISPALLPTHRNAWKGRAPSCKMLSLLAPATFSYRLPGVPLDTEAVPGRAAEAQPSSAWMVEARCCTGHTCVLHPRISQEGRNFPPFTFILYTTKTVSRSSHLWEFPATQNESSFRLSSLTFHYRGSDRNQ